MAYLRDALDDPLSESCGKCANCPGRPVVDPRVDAKLVVSAKRFLRTTEFPLLEGVAKAPPRDNVNSQVADRWLTESREERGWWM